MEITETYEQWEERVTRLARERAMEEGKAAGQAQGKAEGKAEAKLEVTLRMLKRRFGPIEPEVMRRVQAAPDTELDAILDRLFIASSLDEALD
jgi:flagellar biosynthesis/type III secretory pathway protein FliH